MCNGCLPFPEPSRQLLNDMEPTKELIDELYREDIRDARAMKPWDKFLAGAQLFDMACRIVVAGIRYQHPETDDVTVQQILEQRLELARKLEATQ